MFPRNSFWFGLHTFRQTLQQMGCFQKTFCAAHKWLHVGVPFNQTSGTTRPCKTAIPNVSLSAETGMRWIAFLILVSYRL